MSRGKQLYLISAAFEARYHEINVLTTKLSVSLRVYVLMQGHGDAFSLWLLNLYSRADLPWALALYDNNAPYRRKTGTLARICSYSVHGNGFYVRCTHLQNFCLFSSQYIVVVVAV